MPSNACPTVKLRLPNGDALWQSAQHDQSRPVRPAFFAPALFAPALQGFLLGAGLIIAIGAQNVFVLRHGLPLQQSSHQQPSRISRHRLVQALVLDVRAKVPFLDGTATTQTRRPGGFQGPTRPCQQHERHLHQVQVARH
jgi:hypothetical protein